MEKILLKRKVNIAYVQETRWASKPRDEDGYKLWYSGILKDKNVLGILVDRELRESVVEVRRVHDSADAPQMGLDEELKRLFEEGLDEIVRNIPPAERLFIGGDFTGNIGSTACGYGEVHGSFDFGNKNARGTSQLDFTKA
uniref:Craniofacial development protein 2-like n=1 Tax=Nicotiana tabacum TaxID=4097 RepID=A0A1S4DKD6_TOBAC|nr:PREDICTED: uncharacterized protein LOC107830627 [Nicotiana tabacum]